MVGLGGEKLIMRTPPSVLTADELRILRDKHKLARARKKLNERNRKLPKEELPPHFVSGGRPESDRRKF
jgi:hypothetical protein